MKNKNVEMLAVVLLAALCRLVPHPANIAPIAALALWSGSRIGARKALALPLLAMFVSDIFLGFHRTMPFVYGSFALTALIGFASRKKISRLPVFVFATLTSSALFFLITNFGVWLTTAMYAKSIAGLYQCYLIALPFFRNTLLGDFFYSGLFVYGTFFLENPSRHIRLLTLTKKSS